MLTQSCSIRVYFAYNYQSRVSIELTGTGNGDVNEFFDHVKQQKGGFGFARVETGDNESRRAKFFLLAYVPEEGPNKLPIMVKGNISVHKAAFKSVFKDFNSEFTFGDQGDFDAKKVIDSIVKAGGANYMGQTA